MCLILSHITSRSIYEIYRSKGGAEVSLSTDYRIISHSGVIQFVQVRNGVSTGFGGGIHLTRIVGKRTALNLLGTSKRLDAQSAFALGVADKIISGDNMSLIPSATEFLQEFTQWSHKSIRAIKSVVQATHIHDQRLYEKEQEVFEQQVHK